MTDYKQLCTELLNWATLLIYPPDPPVTRSADELSGLIARARAALAEPQGEGPTDEDDGQWQWYTYCPEEGIELYDNKEQARSAAESIMGSYQVAAHSDFWHEDMEMVQWGKLVPFERAQVVDRRQAEPGGEWDEWVQYELRTPRYGRSTPPPPNDLSHLSEAEFQALAPQGYHGVGDDEPAVPEGREPASVAQQATALQPVPISERLPGPEDCDEVGMCWWWWADPIDEHWEFGPAPAEPGRVWSDGKAGHTHWLPFRSIPQPS